MDVDHDNYLTGEVIGRSIDVHRALGPGLKESAYEEALERKLRAAGFKVNRQQGLPLRYKGVRLNAGFRIDLLVEGKLPLELKAVEEIHPIHEAQLLTYLRLGPFQLGLLMNFNVAVLKDGIRRKVQTQNWIIPETTNQIDGRSGDRLTGEIVASAVEIHRNLGPGLLPSAYECALCHELSIQGIPFERRIEIPIAIDGVPLKEPADIPLLIDQAVPVFCFGCGETSPLHRATALARLRQGRWKRGLILNFNVDSMVNGITRISN